MTINYGDQATLSDAYRVLLGRALREVEMLREQLPEAAFGSGHCRICLRSYPHGDDVHKAEELTLISSPECTLNLPTIKRG